MVTPPDAIALAPRGLQRLAPRALVLALIIWWWPSLTGAGDSINVLLAGSPDVVAESNPVIRRIREGGHGIDVHPEWTTWCDAQAVLEPRLGELTVESVVLSFAERGACADAPGGLRSLAARAHDEGVSLVVMLPGSASLDDEMGAAIADLDADDLVTVVDASRLINADASVERMPCQWWDDCESDGQVAVRDATGALTDAGLERMARVLVSVLP